MSCELETVPYVRVPRTEEGLRDRGSVLNRSIKDVLRWWPSDELREHKGRVRLTSLEQGAEIPETDLLEVEEYLNLITAHYIERRDDTAALSGTMAATLHSASIEALDDISRLRDVLCVATLVG